MTVGTWDKKITGCEPAKVSRKMGEGPQTQQRPARRRADGSYSFRWSRKNSLRRVGPIPSEEILHLILLERTNRPPSPATNEGLQKGGSSSAEPIRQTEIHPRVQVCIMQNESTRTFSATVRISVPVYVNLGSFLLGIN